MYIYRANVFRPSETIQQKRISIFIHKLTKYYNMVVDN